MNWNVVMFVAYLIGSTAFIVGSVIGLLLQLGGDPMKIYLAHPISGLGYEEVVTYFLDLARWLQEAGYEPFHPMTGKGYLRTEKMFKASDYRHPASTNHAIIERDRWMIQTCDLMLCDLSGAETASIGCAMELAWAHQLGKHSVVVMEEENVHRHAFILEAADVVFLNIYQAKDYLGLLIRGAM